MHSWKMFAVGVATLLFVACQNDDGDDKDGSGKSQLTGYPKVSLVSRSNTSQSRAAASEHSCSGFDMGSGLVAIPSTCLTSESQCQDSVVRTDSGRAYGCQKIISRSFGLGNKYTLIEIETPIEAIE